MKTLKLTALALFLLASSSSLIAQTADEIVSKYITTIGGAAKLKALKGVKMEMVVNAQGMEIPVEIVQEPGGKMYVKINIQGKEITQMASDGETVWSTSFMTMKAEKSDAETTANAKLSAADFPDPWLLRPFKRSIRWRRTVSPLPNRRKRPPWRGRVHRPFRQAAEASCLRA